ncbi:unnamed protein product [Paramecium sonneborni]|uniref:Kinesin motor domain-containing protein n=1 Tax=Paramecium sonneborni TaxID=65129 RepID=A0A8S1RKR0_9CILI|nr:unnamed protein product [Paramecium sonneborni]
MSVKIATRVRPFNKFEIQQNLPLCIAMDGNRTILFDNNQQKEFEFDYSFWSHDKFEIDEKGYHKPLPNSRYLDQKMIFNTISQDPLNQPFQGQNCCILAFGQQGSGKSYTLLGTNDNQGLIYNFVKEVINQISQNQIIKTKYEVYISMLFIYNESVYDQLSQTDFKKLKVRENALKGVQVENLIKEQVDSIENFELNMKKGVNCIQKFQTMLSIRLSLLHQIFQIEIKETKIVDDQFIEKFNKVNLVDLAWCEKFYQINNSKSQIAKSLSTLGEIICKLIIQSQQQDKKIFTPYRNSQLTRILQETLKQKSKIILIITISPALNNFEQTLCNLRFANQFMKVKNNIICNTNLTENNQFQDLKQESILIQKLNLKVQTNQQQIESTQDYGLHSNILFNEKFYKSKEIQNTNDIQDQEILQHKDEIIGLKLFPLKESCDQIYINNQQINNKQKYLIMIGSLLQSQQLRQYNILEYKIQNRIKIPLLNKMIQEKFVKIIKSVKQQIIIRSLNKR